MKLSECAAGDIVKVWCIGWGTWDNEYSKVLSDYRGGIFIECEHPLGSKKTVEYCAHILVRKEGH